jgi:hypothetical protein
MRTLVWACLAAAGLAAQELPRDLAALVAIKRRMAAELARVPDYTCLQTVVRHVQGRQGPARALDTLRLEVAHLGAQELYGWPGEAFDSADPGRFVAGGLIGTGVFALHARSLFVNDAGTFRYAGEETCRGRSALRFDYELPVLVSGYRVQANGKEATVASRGSFWADRRTLDLIRMEIVAEEIPAELGIVRITTGIDYGRTQIGASSALLPESAEMVLENFTGERSRNVVGFTHCRQYGSQSAIRFGEGPPAPSVTGPAKETELPSRLVLRLALDGPLDSEKIAIGDPVRARLKGELRQKGKTVAPDGARVSGRVRRLERYDEPEPYCIVGLEFSAVELPDRRARFFAELREVAKAPGVEGLLIFTRDRSGPYSAGGIGSWLQDTKTWRIFTPDLPGVGTFFVRGGRFELPAGFETVWRTAALKAREAPVRDIPQPAPVPSVTGPDFR